MKLLQTWFSWLRNITVVLLVLSSFSLTPTPVSAATEYNETIQFIDDFDSCSGERVLVTGIQHIFGRFTKDGAGRMHFSFTRYTKGTGVGQISGGEYLLTDAVTRGSLEFGSGEVKTLTEQYSARLIHKG